jgi:hypothetical protein
MDLHERIVAQERWYFETLEGQDVDAGVQFWRRTTASRPPHPDRVRGGVRGELLLDASCWRWKG